MLTADDIMTYNGEPVLGRLETLREDDEGPRVAMGLAMPLPENYRERAVAMAMQLAERIYGSEDEIPDEVVEDIEEQADQMPEFAFVGIPSTFCWN